MNPDLKVLISIGDDREEGAHKYSNMVSTASRRREFIRSVIQFLEEFAFDGIDLHWQYPGAEELGGRASDKMNLSKCKYKNKNTAVLVKTKLILFGRLITGRTVRDLPNSWLDSLHVGSCIQIQD